MACWRKHSPGLVSLGLGDNLGRLSPAEASPARWQPPWGWRRSSSKEGPCVAELRQEALKVRDIACGFPGASPVPRRATWMTQHQQCRRGVGTQGAVGAREGAGVGAAPSLPPCPPPGARSVSRGGAWGRGADRSQVRLGFVGRRTRSRARAAAAPELTRTGAWERSSPKLGAG